jgi:hypothetical protein
MARRHGGEKHTHFEFLENGAPTVRRVHEIQIQGMDGQLHILRGKEMPPFIHLNTGTSHKGKHVAQILLDPKNYPPPPRGKLNGWPSLRDASHLVVGMTFFFLLFRAIKVLADLP